MDRWEYVVAGAPLEEISIAEPLASAGETLQQFYLSLLAGVKYLLILPYDASLSDERCFECCF